MRAAALVGLLVTGALSCAAGSSPNVGFEIDCRGVPCDWEIVQGTASFGPTWHEGDVGVDLSGSGRSVVQQKAVLQSLEGRQLELSASVVRDPGVSLRFELLWYAPGTGTGRTFWERTPTFLDIRTYDVREEGVNRIRRTVAVPSESAAVILRIVKDGNGLAMVDELSLGRPSSPGATP